MIIDIKIISPEETETAFILTRELMEYHNALDIFTMTPQRFKELTESGALMSFIAYIGSEAVGVMNAFYKYTTFSGRKILYIEDLYAREKYRGCGIGGKLLDKAKEIAAENDCEQIELKCAVWNKNSAAFYEAHGMQKEKEWNVYTLNKSSF
ncbi:MAG: GNAT family N-acetyltransferase [Ruminococcus sp.]|nr:GNAT family N-acetyltransferase [Ruminococcus sp.]